MSKADFFKRDQKNWGGFQAKVPLQCSPNALVTGRLKNLILEKRGALKGRKQTVETCNLKNRWNRIAIQISKHVSVTAEEPEMGGNGHRVKGVPEKIRRPWGVEDRSQWTQSERAANRPEPDHKLLFKGVVTVRGTLHVMC